MALFYRNFPNRILISILLSIFITQSCDNKIDKYKTLVVAIECESSTIFQYNNNYYGYLLSIARSFAKDSNLKLHFVECKSVQEIDSLMGCGKVDMAILSSSLELDEFEDINQNIDVLRVSAQDQFTVLAKEPLQIDSVEVMLDMMKGKRVSISKSFVSSPIYQIMQDSTLNITTIIQDTLFGRASSRDLAFGRADFAIVGNVGAKVLGFIYKNCDKVYDVLSNSTSYIAVAGDNYTLYNDFSDWYFDYYQFSEAIVHNKEIYNTNKYVEELLHNGYIANHGELSPYDAIFIEIDRQTGEDWRLLAAIAHYESHMNPHKESNRGARGLLQIMPKVAVDNGYVADSLFDPTYNSRVSAHILDEIKGMLNYSGDTLTIDQLSIVLACYNAGYVKVKNSLKATKAYGHDNNKWNDIAQSVVNINKLKNEGDTTFNSHNNLVSSHTRHYVNSVIARYKENIDKVER